MNQHDQLAKILAEGLSELSDRLQIQINTEAHESLLQFVHLLAKWNRVYNLTAVRDTQAMVQRHLLDSLVLCRWLPSLSTTDDALVDVADIGSGAGLPVLPLAIARPDLRFVSVESNGKKTRFQQQVLVELNITNIDIRHERVQDSVLQSRFVTSRAFTAPVDFLNIAVNLCAVDALVALMLGHSERLPDELPAQFRLSEVVPVDIPGSSGPRHIALCRRIS